MCYHYSIAKTAEEIADRYNVTIRSPGLNPQPLYYHVNGFNFRLLPIVYQDIINSSLKLEFMQWGMVPGWIKGEEQAFKIRSITLNARAETVDSKPSFRAAFRYRPCLVPATGYFEWMHYKGKKYPFHIYIPEMSIFSFAGIWEEWVNEQTGEILRSFSIITCGANSLTAKIHNTKERMPVILDRKSEEEWIDLSTDKIARKDILKPYDADKMNAYSIGRLITAKDRESNLPEILDESVYPELIQ